jgi:hypothetical protein
VKLLAASLLLDDPAAGQSVAVELNRLARSGDRYLSNLARAQLWRKEDSPSPAILDTWRRDIERMPEIIRGGPWFVLGQALIQRMELDAGAAALLRVLLVHHGNEPLAIKAGRDAAAALDRLNRQDEADAIRKELAESYGNVTAD